MSVRFAAILAIAMFAPQWRDPSPHQIRFVRVGGTTRLEVLDWGGSGRPVLFVGCYLTAHVYDNIAPKLTDQFHVYAVTRRGVGASDHPATGYDPQRRADDIFDVITALGMRDPILVGNSCGGPILHVLGAQHPDRIGGLMYLDAAEDQTLTASDYTNSPSVDRAHLPQHVKPNTPSVGLPEAETRQLERWPMEPGIRKAITQDNNVKPDYVHIAVPVLAIFRTRTWDDVLAEYRPKNDEERAALAQGYAAGAAMLSRWESDLRRGVPGASIVELPGAESLYVHLERIGRDPRAARVCGVFAAPLNSRVVVARHSLCPACNALIPWSGMSGNAPFRHGRILIAIASGSPSDPSRSQEPRERPRAGESHEERGEHLPACRWQEDVVEHHREEEKQSDQHGGEAESG